MHKHALMIATAATAVLVLTLGAGSSAYAIWGHGSSYGPSFGGTDTEYYSTNNVCVCSYKDGLTINGESFDVSKPSQTIPTQSLYYGVPAHITLKIFSNSGTYAINGGAVFLNVNGPNPSISKSDTWIQFDKYGTVVTHDPHNILGDVTVNIKYDKNYMYATLNFTPKATMKTSDLILEAWDYRLSVGTTAVIDALQITYLPFSFH